MAEHVPNRQRMAQLEEAVRRLAECTPPGVAAENMLSAIRGVIEPEEKKPPKPTPHHEWYVSEFPYHAHRAAVVERESAQSWDASRRQAIIDVVARLKWFGYKESARIIEKHDWETPDA